MCSVLKIQVRCFTFTFVYFLGFRVLIPFMCTISAVYRVQLQKCTNIRVNDQGLAVCVGRNCCTVLGSVYAHDEDQVVLRAVREVLFRPLGSYIQGKFMHNVNTHRMMYAEMIERGAFNTPKMFFDLPHHTIEPRTSANVDEPENLLQVNPQRERSAPSNETVDPKPRIRVKDFASLDLYGPNKNFLGRIVLNGHHSARLDSTDINLAGRETLDNTLTGDHATLGISHRNLSHVPPLVF